MEQDRRIRRTKKILTDAFITLLASKKLNDITIKELCETADINRSTFYHHYDSQFELFNDILNDIGNDITQIVKSHQLSSTWMKDILNDAFTYIEERREMFLVVLSENSGFSVGETLTSYVERFINMTSEPSNEIVNYCTQFATAGMTSVVWKWLNHEERMPAKDLANMVAALLTSSIGRFTLFPLQ